MYQISRLKLTSEFTVAAPKLPEIIPAHVDSPVTHHKPSEGPTFAPHSLSCGIELGLSPTIPNGLLPRRVNTSASGPFAPSSNPTIGHYLHHPIDFWVIWVTRTQNWMLWFMTKFESRMLTDAKYNDTQGTQGFIQVWTSVRIKTLRHMCISVLWFIGLWPSLPLVL
jgi:hypothetical protein